MPKGQGGTARFLEILFQSRTSSRAAPLDKAANTLIFATMRASSEPWFGGPSITIRRTRARSSSSAMPIHRRTTRLPMLCPTKLMLSAAGSPLITVASARPWSSMPVLVLAYPNESTVASMFFRKDSTSGRIDRRPSPRPWSTITVGPLTVGTWPARSRPVKASRQACRDPSPTTSSCGSRIRQASAPGRCCSRQSCWMTSSDHCSESADRRRIFIQSASVAAAGVAVAAFAESTGTSSAHAAAGRDRLHMSQPASSSRWDGKRFTGIPSSRVFRVR